MAGDRSPPREPTSLPTPLTTTVENWTTNAELPRGAKATTIEAEGLGAMGRKRGRSGEHQIKKRKLPAEVAKAGRMLSPERMRIVLDSLREYPVRSNAASKAGIHGKTLAYWIRRSAAGDVGYDIKWQGLEWRFHEHCQSAIEEAHDKLLETAWGIAMGADLKDGDGKTVPAASRKQRGEMIRFLLEWRDILNKVNNVTAASVKARKWKAGWRLIQNSEV